jgi:fructokinase
MTCLVNAIHEIAKKNPDGFTVEVPGLKPVTSGYVAAYAATQDCFGRKGLEKVVSHALEHGRVVGGWRNTENRKFYFDSDAVFTDKDAAIEFGRKNGQIAIYDLDSLTEIRL